MLKQAPAIHAMDLSGDKCGLHGCEINGGSADFRCARIAACQSALARQYVQFTAARRDQFRKDTCYGMKATARADFFSNILRHRAVRGNRVDGNTILPDFFRQHFGKGVLLDVCQVIMWVVRANGNEVYGQSKIYDSSFGVQTTSMSS